MGELGWIPVGGVTTLLRPATLERLLLPMVALAAGTLLGGAFFHMIPEGAAELPPLGAAAWTVAGSTTFLLLEQFLNWHHSDVRAGGGVPEVGEGWEVPGPSRPIPGHFDRRPPPVVGAGAHGPVPPPAPGAPPLLDSLCPPAPHPPLARVFLQLVAGRDAIAGSLSPRPACTGGPAPPGRS